MSTSLTPEFLASISPEAHPRYSPNFHKWLCRFVKQHGGGDAPVGIYRSCDNPGVGYLHVGQLMATRPELTGGHTKLFGAHIMSILPYFNKGTKPRPGYKMAQWVYAPGWLEEYRRIGRCLLDPDHDMWISLEQLETRWVYSDDKTHRTCQWCGAEFDEVTVHIPRKVWQQSDGK